MPYAGVSFPQITRHRRVVGRKYKNVEEQGLRFVFAFDDDAPELLHIYVPHLTSIDDALDTVLQRAGPME